MFTAALFIIFAKIWKQPKCHQQMNGQRRYIYIYYTHTHIMEYYSVRRKKLPFTATWIEPEGFTLYDIAYMWNLKTTINQ